MSTLLHQNFGPAHSPQQPKPPTIASAATVTPITALTFLTGTVQVANIVPEDANSYQRVTLCFTNAAPGAFLTNGTAYPIKTAYQPIQNRPIDLHWDPSSKFWWVAAVV
jgi:hypothetical protein